MLLRVRISTLFRQPGDIFIAFAESLETAGTFRAIPFEGLKRLIAKSALTFKPLWPLSFGFLLLTSQLVPMLAFFWCQRPFSIASMM
jgi:hypothetical protein